MKAHLEGVDRCVIGLLLTGWFALFAYDTTGQPTLFWVAVAGAVLALTSFLVSISRYHRRHTAPPTVHETVSYAGGVAGSCCRAQDRPGRDRCARP